MKQRRYLFLYVLLLFLVTLWLRAILVHYYAYSLGGIEPNVIYGIQRILQGQRLYQDPASGTYAIMQYTPLWYYTVAGAARLLSPDSYHQGLDVQGIYVLSRILALACNLLTVVVCASIIRIWRISWMQSFLFAMPILIVLTPHYYTRGDSMHLLLFALSLYCYLYATKKNRIAYTLLAALFSAACIMTKQSGVLVAGVIAGGFIFMERKYVSALLYLVSLTIFSLLMAWLFTDGDWHALYQNAVLGLKNGIDASFLYNLFISQYFLDMAPCYFLGALMLLAGMRKNVDTTYKFILMAMACSWVFAAVTGLKIGSSNNYFTEFLLILFLGVPYLLQGGSGGNTLFKVLKWPISLGHIAIFALFVLVSSKTAGLVTAIYIDKSYKNDPSEYANELTLYTYFADKLHIQAGETVFFTERRYLDNIFVKYSVMPTKDVITQVFATDANTFNYAGFEGGMNNGRIKYIVTDAKRDDVNVCNDSLPFILYDKSKFLLIARIAGYSVYAWQPGG